LGGMHVLRKKLGSIKPLAVILFLNLNHYINVNSEVITLEMQVRDRPPDMVLEKKNPHGPLIEIIEEAANSIGVKVHFTEASFARTLKDLETGEVDLCPRISKTEEREKYIYFLGPISNRNKITYFLVKKGYENSIKKYSDIKKYKIAVKRGSSYFEDFDHDKMIRKNEHKDDKNMALMFQKNRFKVMAVTDKLAIEEQFKKNNFSDYSYAKYRHFQKDFNYYGMSKKSKYITTKDELNKKLNEMRIDGTINRIYKKYGLIPQ
jgi:polar amino acid transport system substrate-binding protein